MDQTVVKPAHVRTVYHAIKYQENVTAAQDIGELTVKKVIAFYPIYKIFKQNWIKLSVIIKVCTN